MSDLKDISVPKAATSKPCRCFLGYLLRGFKNKAFRTLEDVMNQLQDVIQGLEKEEIKSIVDWRWIRMLFESR